MSHLVRENVFSDQVMSDGRAAYVAGLMEGEGHISLAVRRRDSESGRQITPMVRVSNTNLALLERLVEFTGNGAIWQKNLSARAHRLCYEWVLSAHQARHILPQVKPYLIGKAPQVALVLEYLSMVRGTQGVAAENDERVTAIISELRALNLRGGTAEELEQTRAEFGRQECSVEGCQQRCYRGHPICYHHWQATRELSIGKCEQCGASMEIRDARKRFCSPKCQSAAWNENVETPRRQRIAQKRSPVPCPACGKMVDRTHYGGKRFCDDHCYSSWRARQKKLPEGWKMDRECVLCGTPFSTNQAKKIYCSSRCTKRAYRERHRDEGLA